MSAKKRLLSAITISLISLNATGCGNQASLAPIPQTVQAQQANIEKASKDMPKVNLHIISAEIEVSEADLNKQLTAILELSNEKRIKDASMKIMPGAKIFANGIIEQKIPLKKEPLRIPFTVEGSLKIVPGNAIRFDPDKIKVAGIQVDSLMKIIGLELSNFTKFKDNSGRIDLVGSSFVLRIEKFTDDATIQGSMKDIKSGNKSLRVIF